MIATVIVSDHQAMLRLPLRALDERGLHAGQRVRVDVRPLWGPGTPLIEPDGTPVITP
jgi:hypothetical protein